MKKVLWLLGAMFASITLGVGLIQPEEKVFTPGEYYVGHQEELDPDWRSIYLNQMGGAWTVGQVSDKSVKSLNPESSLFSPETPSNHLWFFAVPKASIVKRPTYNDVSIEVYGGGKMSLVQNIESFKYKTMTFKVPKGTQLISPANSYLVSSSQNSDGAYPDVENTRGKYIQLIVKKDNYAYRITYGDMLMWWSDIGKAEPDSYKNSDTSQPIYNHTVAFSETDRFDSGAVVGIAGVTGRTSTERATETDKAFVTVRVEKSAIKNGSITEVWQAINITDFYEIGG